MNEVVYGVITENRKFTQVLEGSDGCVSHLLEYDFYLIK
jgi:hypothetical protein